MTSKNFINFHKDLCHSKPARNNNKENSESKRRPQRQNNRGANTVGNLFNPNKNAYLLEREGIEGLSVVPYSKKTPMPRNSRRLKWSVHQWTNEPTITRNENFASGRWSETPPKTALPNPPPHWLASRKELGPLSSSTLKSLPPPSSLFSSCYVDESDDDAISIVSGIDDVTSSASGIDDVTSSAFASRDPVYDSGFSQILSEASLSRLTNFSIDTSEDLFSPVSSLYQPSDASVQEVESLGSDEPIKNGNLLLATVLNQNENCKPVCESKEESKVDILETLFINMKC